MNSSQTVAVSLQVCGRGCVTAGAARVNYTANINNYDSCEAGGWGKHGATPVLPPLAGKFGHLP